MESDKNKDITRLMADALREQKLPYKEGAWERFKEFEAEKKRKRSLWPYLSAVAAAAVLVMGVLLTVNQESQQGPAEIVRTTISQPKAAPQDLPATASEEQPEESIVPQPSEPVYLAYNAPSRRSASSPDSDTGEAMTQRFEAAATGSETASEPSTTQAPSATKSYSFTEPRERKPADDVAVSKDSYDALARQEAEPLIGQEKDSRWSFSLELSPNIKNKEVNLGGGVGVSYALTDRLSISSGVSYVALDADRGPNQQDIPQEFAKTSLSNYNYNKSLSSINTSLVGLDIPLNLRFQVNPKMYASAGISVFNVLEESRYNQFEEHVAVLGFTGNNNDSDSPEPVMQTLRTTEISQETPYQGKNFTGFFNFSVGYQLPVLKKLNLAVEPYIKVPIGSLSEQDMDLSNGGLKIKTTF